MRSLIRGVGKAAVGAVPVVWAAVAGAQTPDLKPQNGFISVLDLILAEPEAAPEPQPIAPIIDVDVTRHKGVVSALARAEELSDPARKSALADVQALAESMRPMGRPEPIPLPSLRWDHVEGSKAWSRTTMEALSTYGAPVVETMPEDIADWCPKYPQATRWERTAFWAGLLSTLTKHESTYRPDAVGGGGKWYGLVQILPATARGYECKAQTREALKDGSANLACAVRIMATTVPRDEVVSEGMRGVAADWGPFHQRRKREDMRQWLNAQPYCQLPPGLLAVKPKPRPALTQAVRPVPRPKG